MAKEKAYKILAIQEGISNSQAKSMIDRGLAYVGNKKVMIARGEIDEKTIFRVQKIEKMKTIFDKDGIEYIVDLTRKSTISLKLYKNGQDISSHTATATYSTLSEILGIDFKTFSQLIYQSSTSSLQFLTATDTQRKKFLTSLFNLDEYVVMHEVFKDEHRNLVKRVAEIEGSVNTINGWIKTNSRIDTSEKKYKEVIELDNDDVEKVLALEVALKNINSTNAKISKNNEYKRQLAALDTEYLTKELPENKPDKHKYSTEQGKINQKIDAAKATIVKMDKLGQVCHACLQDIDINTKNILVQNAQNTVDENITKLHEVAKQLEIAAKIEKEYTRKKRVTDEFEKLVNFIDLDMDTELLDKDEIETSISTLKRKITKIKQEIQSITKYNNEVSAYTSKVKLILEQLEEYKQELSSKEKDLEEGSELASIMDILKKSFSTNGLLNFKIEFLVKDLEKQINDYLSELSGGRFYLLFTLNGEKLDIEIIDDGEYITIDQLSAGELARVNVSTLLAIRKLMSILSSTKINLLFLDEVMGVLDEEGKEKLIDILFKETDLNTFIIDHTWSHPLVPKLYAEKVNNISTIREA